MQGERSMGELGLSLPIKDEACKGALGQFFVKFYHSTLSENYMAQDIHVGRRVISAEQAFNLSNKVLAEQHARDEWMGNQGSSACAASILRLCLRHEDPTLEIVENTISVAEDAETMSLDGFYAAPDAADGIAVTSARIKDGPYSSIVDTFQRFVYLPSESYSATLQDHQGIFGKPTGDGHWMRFGLTGNETLLEARYLMPLPVEA